MNKPRINSHDKQQGFVLVLTISMIAIALLASSFIARWIDSEVENHYQLSNSLQQKADQYSTLSTIIYMATTHPSTYAGIAFPKRIASGYTLPVNEEGDPNVGMQGNELRIDNRLYQGIGSSRFQIQDEAGLISVNTLTSERLTTLFAMTNVNKRYVPGAIAKLNDYIDSDSNYRPDGAEIKQYHKLDYEGPSNHRLRTPQELSSILDWTSIMSNAQFNKIATFLTATPVVPININTAPRESLLVIGLSPEEVDRIIVFRERESITFANIAMLLPSTNKDLNRDIFQYYTSRSLRVTISSGKQGKINEYYLQINTQIEDSVPWYIRYKKIRYQKPGSNFEEPIATGKAIFSGY